MDSYKDALMEIQRIVDSVEFAAEGDEAEEMPMREEQPKVNILSLIGKKKG